MMLKAAYATRDRLQEKLIIACREYDSISATSARSQARLSRLAREIEKLKKGIDRCNTLIEVSLIQGIR